MKKLPPTCAICADPILGEVLREPLGRDDAMVNVCSDCSGDKPVAPRELDPAYECGDDLFTPGFKRAVAKAEKAIVPVNHPTRAKYHSNEPRLNKTDGFVLERVLRYVDGRYLSAQESAELAAKQPWWSPEVRYLGCKQKYAIYERPDRSLVDRSRRSEADPLEALRGMEVEP